MIIIKTKTMNPIKVKELPAMNLAHYKMIGRFDEIGIAFKHLMEWAGPKGILGLPDTRVMTVYHADPHKTGPEKVEQSACVSIDDETEVGGEIQKMNFPGGKYAVGHYEISSVGFEKAWGDVCRWVEKEGFEFVKGISCEIYHNDHENHPEKKHIVDICVPIN